MSSSPRQQQSYAFVTLLSSSDYLPGALVLAASLRALHPKSSSPIPFKLVCLVTPETVDAGTIGKLRESWDLVVGVEVLEHEGQSDGLKLLGRPDLHAVLTKLHVFRLAPFTKIIFLDADVLPLKSLSHLFAIPNVFSAAPDTGWPDCFNSGVMVLEPSQETFDGLMSMMSEGEGASGDGTFDGGDQGILNQYFNGEEGRPEWNRISFTYNTTPTAAYTYAPAYKHYGPKIHAVHFIGSQKPWSSLSYRSARPLPSESLPYDYNSLIDRWFGIYDKYVRTTYALRSFEVPKTVAAWDSPEGAPGGRLGLEELKKVAEQGWWRRAGADGALEGAYMALPREGRIDLMRRPREPEPEPIPPPSSPSPPPQQETAAPFPPSPVIQSPEPIRPRDQYLTTWDPARSSPPRGSGPEHHQMREPIDSKYENAWDLQERREQQENDRRWREGGGGRQIWDVPSEMRDGRYNITTEQWQPPSLSGSIFPWETRQRQAPTRVFPRGETPPPQSLPQIIEPTNPTIPQPSVQQATPSLPAPSSSDFAPPPPRSFDEAMRGYINAWDADPRIARYVTRLSGDSPGLRVATSAAPVGGEENFDAGAVASGGAARGRKEERLTEGRRRAERSRDGGEEGDDEDEEDESEESVEGVPVPKRKDNRGGGGGAPGGGGGLNTSLGTARPSGRSPRRTTAPLPPASSDQTSQQTQTSRTYSQQSSYSSRAIQTSPLHLADAAVQASPDPSQTANSSATSSPFPNSPTSGRFPQQSGPPSYPTSEIPPSLPHSPSTHPHHHTGSIHHQLQQTSPTPSPAGEGLLGLKRYAFGEGDHSREPSQGSMTTSSSSTVAESVATPTAMTARSPERSLYVESGRGGDAAGGSGGNPTGRSWDPARNVEQLKDQTLSTLERYMREADQQRN